MDFERARKLVSTIMVLCLILCVLSVVTLTNYSEESMLCSYLILALVVVGGFIWAKYCKCPHCGKRLFRKMASIQKCPHCGKPLNKNKKDKYNSGKMNNPPRLH